MREDHVSHVKTMKVAGPSYLTGLVQGRVVTLF